MDFSSLIKQVKRLGESLKLTSDSRKVDSKTIFVAMAGITRDGHDFIADVLKKNPLAIVAQKKHSAVKSFQKETKLCLVENTRAAYAELSAIIFSEPSKNLKIIGITGTNGKTSTTHFIQSILNECSERTGVIGTLANKFESFQADSTHTTPDAYELQKIFRDFKTRGASAIAMEVSSHGLDQLRTHSTQFECVVFTNLTQDHLDYHKTMEDYFLAKARLFLDYSSRFRVIHIESAYGKRLAKMCKEKKISFVTFGKSGADFNYKKLKTTPNGIEGEINKIKVKAPVYGEFNIENICAAVAVCVCLGKKEAEIQKALKKIKPVDGRLEKAKSKKGYQVYIDYAHTPDALEKVLSGFRKESKGKVYCIFGCGGDRDPMKRPIMGKIAQKNADHLIITSDNPRSEDPEKIIKDILKGIKKSKNLDVVLDRRSAIELGVNKINKKDILLIAGKGHERYQLIKDKKLEFDDKKIAEDFLNAKK